MRSFLQSSEIKLNVKECFWYFDEMIVTYPLSQEDILLIKHNYVKGITRLVMRELGSEHASLLRFVPQESDTIKEVEFRDSVKRLLGDNDYQACINSRFSVSQLCSHVAVYHLTHRIADYPGKQADLDLVSHIAKRLWFVDGTTGFTS